MKRGTRKRARHVLVRTLLPMLLMLTLGAGVKASPEQELGFSGFAITALGIGIAIAGMCLGVGWAMGVTCSAAAGAIAEKPEISTRLIIFVVFIEAIAIYVTVILLMIIMKLPSYAG